MRVSSPEDSAEKEASARAKKVARMPAPDNYGVAGAFQSPYLARFADANMRESYARDERATRQIEGQPNVKANIEADIKQGLTSGSPLPMGVRHFMEPRFRANFGKVKIHTGDRSAKLNQQLNARAFAAGGHVFFGRDKFQPETEEGRELIAHELTHTIQQGAASQPNETKRSRDETVSRSDSLIQRLEFPSLSDPREWFAGKAAAIPGFTMLTVVIGYNPVTNASVDRSPGNILRGAIEMIPGGSMITDALNNHGIFEKVSQWVSQQFNALKEIGSIIVDAIAAFISGIGVTDLASPGELWDRAKRLVTGPIERIKAFASSLKDGIVQLIKDAILRPLAAVARNTRGYDLLCAVMGRDPITGEPVAQDAEALVGGFLKFIGEEETWDKIKKANALPRISVWFKSALGELKGFVSEIPGLFLQAFKSLELLDIILVPRAFAKLVGVFGNFASRFVSWGAAKVWKLLEIIFDVVSPGAFAYIQKAGASLKGILRNPLPFVGNLVKAAKLGFQNFAANFGGHFKAGLIEWLTGALPGVYIPTAFSLKEIAKFVFSVLGLTWANIRQKLVKVVGEPAVKAMETGFDIVVTLVTQGPAAAWDKIKDQLSNLKDMVISGITDFVIDIVVKKAVPKLISMFIPGAGFISAILSIYDTVMVFVNKISKIIQVVTGFINSITAIAAGAIGAAASKVESTLAGLLSLAINFLAGFVGLGKVADKVMGVINKVRAPIDKALDWLIGWIVTMAKKLFAKAFGKKVDGKTDERTEEQKKADLNGAVLKGNQLLKNDKLSLAEVRKGLTPLQSQFRLQNLTVVGGDKDKKSEKDRIKAEINPVQEGEWVKRDRTEDTGFVVWIRAILGPPQARRGYEKDLPSASEYEGVPAGMEKAHGLGAGTGRESGAGIRLAAKRVNQELQNRGIEKFLRGLFAKVKNDPNSEFSVNVAVKSFSGTLRLQEISYQLVADINGRQRIAMEATITVSDAGAAPSASASVDYVGAEFAPFLVSVAESVFSRRLDKMDEEGTVRRKATGNLSSGPAPDSLKVSSPGDSAEREAETTARAVMQMQPPEVTARAEDGTKSSAAAPESEKATVLPSSVRDFMEPRFGADFGDVRIHTGEKAASLSRSVSAEAFAVGSHIYFAQDKYQPETHAGKELIAHELTHTLQEGAVIRRRIVNVGGVRMYITAEGKSVALPPDVTDAQATKLEGEAIAAKRKLGKRPPPKTVPDLKKVVRKEARKKELPPAAKSRGEDPGKGGKTPPVGTLASGLLRSAGTSKVAQYLVAKATPILARGIGRLHKLKQNEQTHDDAAKKLQQSQKAVVTPASENQSVSNASQVTAVSSHPAPPVDQQKPKQRLQQSLAQNIPSTIEDVDNFKRDMKAQHMSADVMLVVQGDKNAVVSTFAQMEQTPPPAPPEHAPESLPAEEKEPATPNMNLGQDAIAPLKPEHTDVTSYTKEADGKLKEEGVSQEQLDMVDSGDLAEANKEKKGMEKTAKTEPVTIQKFAQQTGEAADKDLRQEEKKGRGDLSAKRKTQLGATAQKQKGAKSALEKQHDEVGKKINGIFQAAQDKVKKKLEDLEKNSIRRFDEGNARASKQFEDNVKRELEAYKAERYSGWLGGVKEAKDWLLGMDDLPEVKAIFERNRAAFVSTINKLSDDITADNKRVVQECKDDLANARKDIKDYVSKLGPSLRDIGQKAATEMNAKLNDLDGFINKKEEELQNKLKDKQSAAIKAIDEKIDKMKEAMSGALSKLGKLLLLAAKKFFTWALEKFGVSLGTIEGIIDKGSAVLKAIFTKPIQFVKNLVNAAITGFKNFGKNFLKHLKDSLFEWLTGSLGGITLPETWDFRGIISVALQMIGISYQNIRKHMVTVMGENVVAGLEKTFTLVKTLITEGPMAAWEQLKEMAGEMRDAFIDAVKDYVKMKIIEEAIKAVGALLIPGAGIIKAILSIYDTIVFFIQKAKQIAEMIGSFLGSIAEIAAGNIGAAADALENGLARGLTLVINFLAQLLHLSGITGKIRDAIQKIRGKVDAVLLKIAKWIAEKAKKIWGSAKATAKKLFSWAFAKTPFIDDEGKTHSIYVAETGTGAALTIASTPQPAGEFLVAYLAMKDRGFEASNAKTISAIRTAVSQANGVIKEIDKMAKTKADDPKLPGLQRQLLEQNVVLGELLSKLINNDTSIGKAREKYLLEGLTGSYSSIPKPKGDELTADHQPQAAVLEAAATFDYFRDDGALAKRAAGRAHQGYAINLHKIRHVAGATFGSKGAQTKENFLKKIEPAVKRKPPKEQRRLVVAQLKFDLGRDVTAMTTIAKSVYDSPNWADITGSKPNDKKKEKVKLISEIRARILAGEAQVAAQDLESLAK